MTPPPPRSTLFPYTTLFRSKRRGVHRMIQSHVNHSRWHTREGDALLHDQIEERVTFARSEEHTSELQSRLHLVCRLLLEKKKKKKLAIKSYMQHTYCLPMSD